MKTIFPLLVLLALFIPTRALAEGSDNLTAPKARQGYYLSLGAYGALTTSRDHDMGKLADFRGAAFSLGLGQMTTDWLGFGLAIDFCPAQNKRWRQTLIDFDLDVQVAPWRNLSLHALAGLGVALAYDKDNPDDDARGTAGASYGVAVAYDFFFSTRDSGSGGWSIAPLVQLRHISGETFRSTSAWVGVSGTFFSGLDNQELELDLTRAFSKTR